ncbi:DUF421 domain-containing protein [Aciduricibacillus chroicocephali]|uniref:DUF421 domain-containing protein n=1 Tax=Aciduricibacillus chroicocephali TaxID=3054939 RepID=A0ABY9KUC0_9BACI|nr:DUF421 domain-containing protein [Bacillaceae bacterium 44XB]
MEYAFITIKLLTGFILLFFLVHIVGKKMIKQITPFHFISAIVLSELIGDATYNKGVSVFQIAFAILFWGVILFVIEWVAMHLTKFRRFAEGEPSMLIEDGVVNFSTLKSCRMNLSQLQSMLRQSETFSIREVAYCFLEPNGSLSIMKKPTYQKTVQQDFSMPFKKAELPLALIRDGILIPKNLEELGKDEAWLHQQLYKQNIQSIGEVIFADWAENSLYAIRYTSS